MKLIPLSQGKFAKVDDEDFAFLSRWRWYLSASSEKSSEYERNRNYAVRQVKRKTIYLHRFLLDAPSGKTVDHIDGDGLNNTRHNLRVCTQQQNNCNRRGKPFTTSLFKGVSFVKKTKRWMAQIAKNRKRIHIGYFSTEEEAASAYNRAAKKLFGEFANLNKV